MQDWFRGITTALRFHIGWWMSVAKMHTIPKTPSNGKGECHNLFSDLCVQKLNFFHREDGNVPSERKATTYVLNLVFSTTSLQCLLFSPVQLTSSSYSVKPVLHIGWLIGVEEIRTVPEMPSDGNVIDPEGRMV